MTGTVKTERKTGLLIHRGLNRETGESNHTYTHNEGTKTNRHELKKKTKQDAELKLITRKKQKSKIKNSERSL